MGCTGAADLAEVRPVLEQPQDRPRRPGPGPPTLPVFFVVTPCAFSQPAISVGVEAAAAFSKI